MEKIIVDKELSLLSSDDYVFVGRKSSVFKKYRDKAGMYIGKVAEVPENGDISGSDGLRACVTASAAQTGIPAKL